MSQFDASAGRSDERHGLPRHIENLFDIEDMRRRCAAHDQWMSRHPEAVTFAETWADENLEER
jgi:hypothetical protein